MSYVTGSPQQPYRIPSGPSEGRRLLGRFASFSRTIKLGIVGGGLLSLVAVGAMAAPLVASSEPLKHLPFASSSQPSSTARVTSKATEPSHAAPTEKATAVEPTRTPATTLPAAPKTEPTKTEPTKATTKATEPTKAPTTKATEPVKTSTAPEPTKTTTTATPSATKSTTSATAKPTVTPNAICTVSGATGVSATGAALVCRTTTTDPVLRWRVAL